MILFRILFKTVLNCAPGPAIGGSDEDVSGALRGQIRPRQGDPGGDRGPLQGEGGEAEVRARRARRGAGGEDLLAAGEEEGRAGVAQGRAGGGEGAEAEGAGGAVGGAQGGHSGRVEIGCMKRDHATYGPYFCTDFEIGVHRGHRPHQGDEGRGGGGAGGDWALRSVGGDARGAGQLGNEGTGRTAGEGEYLAITCGASCAASMSISRDSPSSWRKQVKDFAPEYLKLLFIGASSLD